MAFNSHADLYRQYKEDTKLVAQWLDATSKAYGFRSSGGTQRQARVKHQYTISIADFEPMADFLSLQGHVPIPSYVLTSLSRAIRYRSTYGDYLQHQRHTVTFQSMIEDKDHLFFIDVLKKVQNALGRIPAPSPQVAPLPQHDPTVARPPGFHVLQSEAVEVEDDVGGNAPTPPRTEIFQEPAKDNITFNPWQEDLEEALFQFRLFSVDLRHIRNQIRQLWELYRAGHLGLAGAATAHNVAILVVRKLEQDIHPIFEKCGGYGLMLMHHFLGRYLGTAADEEQMRARVDRLSQREGEIIVNLRPTVDVIIDDFDMAEEEMILAWNFLVTRIQSWRICGSTATYSGKWGPFVPRDDRQNMVAREKFQQDSALACMLVNDIQVLTIFLNPGIGTRLDELSKAIEELVPWGQQELRKHHGKEYPPDINKINLRAIFATQLLLDSVHVLGTSVDRPCKELLDKTARIVKSTRCLRKFYEGSGAPALERPSNLSMLKFTEVAAGFWHGKDPIKVFRQESLQVRDANSPRPPTQMDYYLLRHNAALCGWWLQVVQAGTYSRSIWIANSHSLPLNCARLYFAFVQEGLVPKGSWPDIEAFSTLHRGDLWVGSAPKPGQYCDNLILASGMSVVYRARGARAKLPGFTRNPKHVNHNTKVSQKITGTFSERMVEGLSKEDLQRFIADSKLRWYNGTAVKPCFHHGWDKAGNHKGDNNPKPSKSDNLFLRLAQTIDAEALEHSFDYMSLSRVCWMVLQELIKRGRPILDSIDGPHTDNKAWEGAEVGNACIAVGFILGALFLQDGYVYRKEASAIADILLNLMKAFGRVVHDSTGVNWAEELKCSCADIEKASTPLPGGN
ncbi:hypothetical protein F5Y10DRAFT_292978 [Nemania abortiva]|nr:hypothetical protein F5Y10DRAFT_292978 [Nemania abortiva]